MSLKKLDRWMITEMRVWGEPALRIALGIVFVWFGALKLLNLSPITELLMQTWGTSLGEVFASNAFIQPLGIVEVLIGVGLIFKRAMRTTLALLWIQMFAIFLTFLFHLPVFTGCQKGFFPLCLFYLQFEGEFIIKNLVLVAAGLVIGGHDVKK